MERPTVDTCALAKAKMNELLDLGLDVSLTSSKKHGKMVHLLKFSQRDESNEDSKSKTTKPKSKTRGKDQALFERLSELRALFAKKEDTRRFIVAANSLLRAIADTKPTTLDELAQITGIDEKKLDAYGQAMLDVVAGMSPEEAFRKSTEAVLPTRETVPVPSSNIASAALPKTTASNKELTDRLHKLRNLIRDKEGGGFATSQPQILENIAKARPESEAALYRIRGLGDAKIRKYGRSILDVVAGMSPEEAYEKYRAVRKAVKDAKRKKKPKKSTSSSSSSDSSDSDTWRPSRQLLYHYQNDVKEVNPETKFGRWCAKKGYTFEDVKSGKVHKELYGKK